MAACKGCNKALGADNWARCEVVKAETGRYFQTPRRTWHLQAPGVEAFMVDDRLYCKTCYESDARLRRDDADARLRRDEGVRAK